jgi:PilZ domain-containing protein
MAALAYPGGSRLATPGWERRLTSRFPLQQEIRYRLIQPRAGSGAGIGETLDISSKGILFTTPVRLSIGCTVEIAMHWPALLNGNCLLQFIANGRVVRSDGNSAAVRIQRYEFRTRAAVPPAHS